MAGVFIKHGTRGETNLETDADAFFFFFFLLCPHTPLPVFKVHPETGPYL